MWNRIIKYSQIGNGNNSAQQSLKIQVSRQSLGVNDEFNRDHVEKPISSYQSPKRPKVKASDKPVAAGEVPTHTCNVISTVDGKFAI